MSDRIVSRPASAAYRENWERIWGNPPGDADEFKWGYYFSALYKEVGDELVDQWRKPPLDERAPEEETSDE